MLLDKFVTEVKQLLALKLVLLATGAISTVTSKKFTANTLALLELKLQELLVLLLLQLLVLLVRLETSVKVLIRLKQLV